MMDRRKFFKVCAAVLGSGFVPVACTQSDGQNEAVETNISSTEYSKLTFDDLPNTTFSVSHDVYGAIDIKLTEVDSEVLSTEAEQFSICMTGPESPVFSEGSYNMYNETLGYIDLYLQPSESRSGEQKYRAIFSLLNT